MHQHTKRWLNVGSNKEQSTGLAALSKLRIPITHSTILCYSALILILFISFTIRFLPVQWEIPSNVIHLNEFDPYYQYMLTQHMVQNGLLSPYVGSGWVNMQVWYPFGLNTQTSLPALPMTAAAAYDVVTALGIHVDLMSFCSMVPVVIGTLACLVMYFIGKDMGGKAVGLFSALFLALAPSYLQRSSLGFFDTEVPGLIGLLVFILFFLRSIDNNKSLRSSILYSVGSALALAYFMSGWGAAFYLLDLVVFFVVILIALRRYTPRLLLSYSITFGLSLLIATKVPYISLHYLVEGPIIPVAAGFVLLLVAEILRNNISARTKTIITGGSIGVVALTFVVLGVTGALGDIAGKFISVINPFARSLAPLIASVAEQTVPTWASIYYDLGILALFLLVGLYFTLRNPTNRNIFLLVFGLTALYFSASMVRLLVLFAPAFSLLVAAGILGTLKPFFTILQEGQSLAVKAKRRLARVSKEYSGFAIFLIFIILVSAVAFSPQAGGEPRVIRGANSPTSISSTGIPIVPTGGPATEWLNALSYCQNSLKYSDVVVAWWDYGDWLSYLGNVTTLVDNTTVNSTQIENVGFIFMANETQSLKLLSQYGQDRTQYIVVFETLQLSQSSSQQYVYTASPSAYGDEQKWAWMARISGSASTRFIQTGFIPEADAWTDEKAFQTVNPESGQTQWTDKGLNSTIYKLLAWAKQEYCSNATAVYGSQGYVIQPDTTANQPTYFTPVFISGIDDHPYKYGGIVPLVAIYKIDWKAYNDAIAAHQISP
jgi:dolichyl-diphosphooligosaccharide---protein glycosyltransferase